MIPWAMIALMTRASAPSAEVVKQALSTKSAHQ
jgi:hypothetical protein